MTRMSLNNSINNYCFSAIFDSSDDPFENYADKKTCTKKAFWLKPRTRTSMHELQKRR